jgi:hypothetical protein
MHKISKAMEIQKYAKLHFLILSGLFVKLNLRDTKIKADASIKPSRTTYQYPTNIWAYVDTLSVNNSDCSNISSDILLNVKE